MRQNLKIDFNIHNLKSIWVVEPEGEFETYFYVINYDKDQGFRANCREDADWLCGILNKNL